MKGNIQQLIKYKTFYFKMSTKNIYISISYAS